MMNYDTKSVNYQSIVNMVIAVTYLIILVPFFAAVLLNLQNEVNKEIVYSFSQKNQFKRMFESAIWVSVLLN